MNLKQPVSGFLNQPLTFGTNLSFLLPAVLQLPECRLMLDMLCAQLPGYLQYHTVAHTLDVCTCAHALAQQLAVPEDDKKLLLVAALYHDSGYLQSAENHEAFSCRFAKELLPPFGYSAIDIETICSLILATRIPQRPHTMLEQIICDADLDYLGRDDFFETADTLYLEMRHRGMIKNEAEWNILQVAFLENHHYFTAKAIEQRQALKEEHLHLLKQKLI